jgi:hypothetical protein
LETFGQNLETDEVPMDVKGSGWLAAFPAENISIGVFNGNVAATRDDEDYLTENFERGADEHPHKFDFLGTGIDAGFRVAKNASSDRFTASIGLALLLASAAQTGMFSGRFSYHGRERLKGVNRDRPYPVVSIEAERDANKRRLRAREKLVTHEEDVSALALFDFLSEFMTHEGIDAPILPTYTSDPLPKPPASYADFEAAWKVNVKESDERDDTITESEVLENQNGDALSADVIRFAGDSLISKDFTFSSSNRSKAPRRKSRPKKPPAE